MSSISSFLSFFSSDGRGHVRWKWNSRDLRQKWGCLRSNLAECNIPWPCLDICQSLGIIGNGKSPECSGPSKTIHVTVAIIWKSALSICPQPYPLPKTVLPIGWQPCQQSLTKHSYLAHIHSLRGHFIRGRAPTNFSIVRQQPTSMTHRPCKDSKDRSTALDVNAFSLTYRTSVVARPRSVWISRPIRPFAWLSSGPVSSTTVLNPSFCRAFSVTSSSNLIDGSASALINAVKPQAPMSCCLAFPLHHNQWVCLRCFCRCFA